MVHWSSPLDLPAKKIWSWGGDANGLRWRRALSDDNSAYAEIQRGLFRDQETYGFLEPREQVEFTEYWVPIRGLGWVSHATPEGVVNVQRTGDGALRVLLNVTSRLPNAIVAVRDAAETVTADTVSLTPDIGWTRDIAVTSARAPVAFTLRTADGATLLTHTEGVFDFTPDSLIRTGPQPRPDQEDRTDGSALAAGELQEREGRLLMAFEAYRAGLDRYPGSLPLTRALGRLAVTLKRYDVAESYLSVALHNSPDVSAGVVFYGINVLLASLRLSLLLFYVAREPGLAVDGIAEQRIKRSRRGAGAQLRNPLRPHEEAGHPGPPTSRLRPGVSIGAWDHAPPPVRHVSLPTCISILESATEIALVSLSSQPLSL